MQLMVEVKMPELGFLTKQDVPSYLFMVFSLNSDTLQLRLSTLIFTSVKDFYCHFITFLIYNSTYPERFIAFTAVNSINSPIFLQNVSTSV